MSQRMLPHSMPSSMWQNVAKLTMKTAALMAATPAWIMCGNAQQSAAHTGTQ
jgi:hypothetical protein